MPATAYALLGPTASGKSRLALELAERHPIEILSVDSAQVYRGMDIGTAKPGAAERARVPHHLIDLVDPDERYSTGRFRADAIRAAAEVLARGRIPLFVGGTALYYRSLASGLDELPAADAAVRAEIAAAAARRGWPALHAELAAVDAPAARRIMPNDAQRIQRALEVHRLTGHALSSLQRGAAAPLPFALKGCALIPERAALHAAIERRFDAMLEAGLVDELRALRRRFALDPALPSMRAVGYRQAWDYLEGRCDTAQMRLRALAATRQLAKRQLTWLRRMPELVRLEAADARAAAAALDRLLQQ
ncbi:MAG TPA: tRNA (adenosine(37)-N6)-dimethylallyltransferase MiaA [Burkholderiales bacterium]|nr:tRNA (adenosine(37)-N6)-dimethylallyltransferase MiaA [Burkholderiales bacterium]